MLKQILLTDRIIEYDLQIKKVKNINLRITAENKIMVSANKRTSLSAIENFILRNQKFIFKALDKNSKKIICENLLTNGEKHRILGKDYSLIIVKNNKNFVQISDDKLYVFVKEPSDYNLKYATFEKWKRKIISELILKICKEEFLKFKNYGVAFPQIKFRKMTTRWGSCRSKSGILTFNYSLINVPIKCVVYVVDHEFTHFLQANHSKAFYQALKRFCPSYKEDEKVLKMQSIL